MKENNEKLKYQIFWWVILSAMFFFLLWGYFDKSDELQMWKSNAEAWEDLAYELRDGVYKMEKIANEWKTRAILCEINN